MTETPSVAPSPREIARLLAETAILLELNGQDSFRARAFANAARSLEGLDVDLLVLAQEERLTTLKGVGPGIASVIEEYVLTGRLAVYEELRAATPLGMYDLLRVPGLGPKRIHTLHQKLGIDSLDALQAAAEAGTIATLPGFGAKTQAKILLGIDFARASGQLRRYPEALETATALLGRLREMPDVVAAEIVGGLRRRMEVVDAIELLAATPVPVMVLDAFVGGSEGSERQEVPEQSVNTVELRLADGLTARLRCVEPDAFVAATVWETGSSAHVEALADAAAEGGGSFGPDGLVLDGAPVRLERETELYEKLGLQFVPPELREGLGEIETARSGTLPVLVELADLRGVFHCHSTYSDGKASLEEMAMAARERGWSYFGIADHSRAAVYAGGLTIDEVHRQHDEINGLNARFIGADPPFHIFKGIESDILPDGSLDYPDEVLGTFDYIVGSVHSAFGLSREEMTNRVIRAVRNPYLTILGHMTGRLLLTRAGYSIDVDAVLEAALEAGVVVEINANPHRLDLDWRHVRRAAEMGVLIAINPDAHSVAAIDHVAFGVNMARKAGLAAQQVLNTWPLDEVKEFFSSRKRGHRT